MRPILLATAVAVLTAPPLFAQVGNYDPPKAVPPDAATLEQIKAKLAELTKAVAAIPEKTPDDVKADVEVFPKAVEWVIRHGEWFTKDTPKQTLAVLNVGLTRAKAAAEGKTPWRAARDKPVIRGYRSRVDGSVQPYSVTIPAAFDADDKKWRLDVVLHGRGATLSEVSFIAGKENAKPAGKGDGFITLEPYGRGNNAYRWAGETDVTEATDSFVQTSGRVDPARVVLRGFSMGGAGTWHLGLHHPFRYAVIGPGAGFTVTRGYIKNLPAKLPDYVEKCLHIYDAVDYSENAFDVPVVAYSGGIDPQKAAADNIEAAVKKLGEPLRFVHLVAPGLEHKMPPEWQAKAEAEFQKYAVPGRDRYPDRVRFVTYTARYGDFGWGRVDGLDRHYVRTLIDGEWTASGVSLKTENARVLRLTVRKHPLPSNVTIDGQTVSVPPGREVVLTKESGKWSPGRPTAGQPLQKVAGLQGPIDDAFADPFAVVGPTGDGWSEATAKHAAGSLGRFKGEWNKYLRGVLPTGERADANLALFGDPASNPLIAKILGKLPITWTKEKLVVNGIEYDPKTHVPVLIYPNPLNPTRYVVINSGHTFHAADFKGTNANLYPRLGDWAVLKPTPTEKDPAAAEVVAAGLFDENWQFPKK